METKATTRRSANYQAGIWDDDFVQSLTTPYMAKEYSEQAEDLKRQVKAIIEGSGTDCRLDQLQLIDDLQRLDISHYFSDELCILLDSVYAMTVRQDYQPADADAGNLFFEALQFRLLRQHGYLVPQDVFHGFLDEAGKFHANLADDAKGVLALYEASFLSMEGETVLDMAKDFSVEHLKTMVDELTDDRVIEQIRHALEVPLHWEVQKLKAKWFIGMYGSRSDANPLFLRLAILDFNMTQAKYQEEIKYLSRWYKENGLEKKVSFARHRLAECFLCALGFVPELHLGNSRRILCKTGMHVTIIDDLYDVYGTLDELEALTDTINRWDVNALDNIPEYMRIIFLALFNTANEISYEIMRDQGLNVISNIRQSWVELSRAYMKEARWYHDGHIPSLEEYLNTGWISVAAPLLILHGYLSAADPIDIDELQELEQHPDFIRWTCMVFRLMDDLGTSWGEMARGDVPKSIQCYMKESGCSEGEARQHVRALIESILKRMNSWIVTTGRVGGIGEGLLKKMCMNLARISQCIYQFGDGFGESHSTNTNTKNNLASLVAHPIPMP